VRGGVILGSVLIMLVCFGLVYLHVLSAQKQFTIDALSTQEQKAQATYQGLRLQVEDDNSPARVMRAALALGMVEPTSITWVQAVPGGAVQPLGAPTAASGTTAPGGISNWPTDKADVAGDP
jgi:cell division protein FtsL